MTAASPSALRSSRWKPGRLMRHRRLGEMHGWTGASRPLIVDQRAVELRTWSLADDAASRGSADRSTSAALTSVGRGRLRQSAFPRYKSDDDDDAMAAAMTRIAGGRGVRHIKAPSCLPRSISGSRRRPVRSSIRTAQAPVSVSLPRHCRITHSSPLYALTFVRCLDELLGSPCCCNRRPLIPYLLRLCGRRTTRARKRTTISTCSLSTATSPFTASSSKVAPRPPTTQSQKPAVVPRPCPHRLIHRFPSLSRILSWTTCSNRLSASRPVRSHALLRSTVVVQSVSAALVPFGLCMLPFESLTHAHPEP